MLGFCYSGTSNGDRQEFGCFPQRLASPHGRCRPQPGATAAPSVATDLPARNRSGEDHSRGPHSIAALATVGTGAAARPDSAADPGDRRSSGGTYRSEKVPQPDGITAGLWNAPLARIPHHCLLYQALPRQRSWRTTSPVSSPVRLIRLVWNSSRLSV